MTDGLLIAGGYGEVGRQVAAELAPRYPGRVIIAGRTLSRASSFASELGHGARARELDVRSAESVQAALSDVRVAVSCIDQPGRLLLCGAITTGLRYTDVTPHLLDLQRLGLRQTLADEARRSGARIIAATGIVPGISSLMARAGADRGGVPVERIETSLLLSIGDRYGPASLTDILEEVAVTFPVLEDGQFRDVVPFTVGADVSFPAPFGGRRAWLFPFSDQAFYQTTLGARTVHTRLTLEPAWAARACAGLMRRGARFVLQRPRSRALLQKAFSLFRRHGPDNWALVVEVTGRSGETARFASTGHRQARATGVAAALFAECLDRDICAPGFWLPEEVLPAQALLHDLASRGIHVEPARMSS